MKRTAYLLAVAALTMSTAALAQNRGSEQDQLACTPDVYNLCAQNIPDEDAIVACLQKHKAQLSAGCKAVFSRPLPQGQQNGDDADD